MAKVSAYQLRKQDKSELQSQLTELKQELMTLRVQKVSGASAGRLTRIKTVKKSIARVLTVINQTQRAKLAEEFKGKKYLPLDLRHKKTRAIRRQLTKHEKGLKTLKQQKKDIHFGARKFAIKA